MSTTSPEKTGIVTPNPLEMQAITTPTANALRGYFYAKDVAGTIEAHYLDSAGNEVQITTGGHLGVSDHSTLLNLAADDHAQYALLAGRAGGQSLIGGTASGEDLTLQSTAHATRGSVKLPDPLAFTAITGATVSVAGEGRIHFNNFNKAMSFSEDGGGWEAFLKPSGRAGGQSLTGGTASGNNLQFTSTAHATKGAIVLEGVVAVTDNSLYIYGASAPAGLSAASDVKMYSPTGGSDLKISISGAAFDDVVVRTKTQTLTNKTLTTPTIGDFTNATHTHQAVATGGQLDHGLALTGLTDDDHTQYLLASGGRALSSNWDAGSYKITASQLESDIATGTAPFLVASTTVVANLNADTVDGIEGASLWNIAGNTLAATGTIGATNGYGIQLWAGSAYRATLPSTGGVIISPSRSNLIGSEQFLVCHSANSHIYQLIANYNLSTRTTGRAGLGFYCYNSGFTYLYQTSETFTTDGYKDARNFIIDTGSNHLKLVTSSAAISFYTTSAERMQISAAGDVILTPGVQTSGSPTSFTLTQPAHTSLTASTEAISVNYNLSATVQFAEGALATQRAFVIQAPTYAFVGASTITTAATVVVTGAPSEGANCSITNPYALWVQAGHVQLDGTLSVGTPPAYTVTNGLTDRAFDADAVAVAELADVVYTILSDLNTMSLFSLS